jgi:hypothetical protein
MISEKRLRAMYDKMPAGISSFYGFRKHNYTFEQWKAERAALLSTGKDASKKRRVAFGRARNWLELDNKGDSDIKVMQAVFNIRREEVFASYNAWKTGDKSKKVSYKKYAKLWIDPLLPAPDNGVAYYEMMTQVGTREMKGSYAFEKDSIPADLLLEGQLSAEKSGKNVRYGYVYLSACVFVQKLPKNTRNRRITRVVVNGGED